MIGLDSTGAGVVFSIARGANADTGSERAVAVLLQQPIGQYEVLDDDELDFNAVEAQPM